jgi:rhodanese-related sulfurtransferase
MVLVVASCVRPATATNQVQEVTVTSYTPRTTTVTTTIPVSEIVDVYLSSGKTPNISAEELYQNINDNDSTNNFYVLDVRSYSDYTKGHIPGAVNIPWREVAKVDNMAKLPKDRQIVVYCYTGHTGSQITALLNVMGYDAVNLKFGMTSWTMDETVAPGRFNNSVDCKGYPIVTGP